MEQNNAESGNIYPHNEATRQVIAYLNKVRTKEQMVKEFFGISAEDWTNAAALKALGVHAHPMLERFGITPEELADMFA